MPHDDILGIKSNAWLGQPVKGSNDHLSSFVWLLNDLPGFYVLNLHQEKPLVHMKASWLFFALIAPGPDFRGTYVIIHLGTPCLFHPLFSGGDTGAGFTCTGDLLDVKVCSRINPQFFPGSISHAEDIGGSSHGGSGLEFLHLKKTGLCVEDTSRDNFASQFFSAIMPGPKCHKYVITKWNKYPVRFPVALGIKDICPCFGPPFPVLPRIRLIYGLAGCATGLSKFRDIF